MSSTAGAQQDATGSRRPAKGGLHVLSEAELETSKKQQASGDRRSKRNRIHPRNWGYTTYLDKVFSMRCFEDLVRMRVFPDAKDISESYGFLQAAIRRGMSGNRAKGSNRHRVKPERRRGVLVISIGDGSTARTATLAAFLTSWTCVSVDPMLRPEWTGRHPHGVKRLHGFSAPFEQWMSDSDTLAALRAEVEADAELEEPSAREASLIDNEEQRENQATKPGSLTNFIRKHRQEWVQWLESDGSAFQVVSERGAWWCMQELVTP